MRIPIIAGNWKLHKTPEESIRLVTELKRALSNVTGVDIVVCPTAIALTDVSDVILESNIVLGAQNLYWEDQGPFTGEISGSMIKSAGCSYVIIGHSERRQYFGETNETVNKKIRSALESGLIPIICVGESLEDRESEKTFDVIKDQVIGALSSYNAEEVKNMVIAYEPLWAIGTGKTATPEQAQDVHKYIRDLLGDLYNDGTAHSVRLQYGGSVKPDNIKDLISKEDIDGALVGGASLKSDSFAHIVKGVVNEE